MVSIDIPNSGAFPLKSKLAPYLIKLTKQQLRQLRVISEASIR